MMKSQLLAEYAPYSSFQPFHDGWDDYFAGRFGGRTYKHGVDEQAYDRGLEAAMRWKRQGHNN
jgi:hypothetical protein